MIAATSRRVLRFPALALLVFAGIAIVLAVFPFMSEGARRVAIRTWSRVLLFVCGVRVSEAPGPGASAFSQLPAGALVVANHVSWLDIFVVNSASPCAFVAKAELARWPVLGILIRRTGTLFIERGKRHAVHRMVEHVARSLQAGARVAVFPEGTTSDGTRLLPFHANLMQAALVAQAAVWPVGLKYEDRHGTGTHVVAYVDDMTFARSLWRITGARGVDVQLRTAARIEPAQNDSRHALAERARLAIHERLGVPLVDEVPRVLREARGKG